MSLLLDALKNAENANNNSDSDSDDKTEHISVDDFVVSTVDPVIDSNTQAEPQVNLESAVDQSSNFVSESEDAKIETANVETPDETDTDPCNEVDSFCGPDRRVAETSSETESPADDHSQAGDQEKNTLDWDLPPDASEAAIAPTNTQAGDFVISPEPQGSNKPEYMHFTQAKAEGNTRTVLLILFILIGTAIGTVFLYFLNQTSIKKPLFTNSFTPKSHTPAISKKPVTGTTLNRNTNATDTKSNVNTEKNIAPTKAPAETNTSKAITTDLDSTASSVNSSGGTSNVESPVAKPKLRLSSLDSDKGDAGDNNTSEPANTSIKKIQTNLQDTERQKTIRIVRHKARSQVSARLSKAYQYYQQGEMLKARALYRQILGSNNKNRDAMLGLAAIAIHFRQTSLAVSYYKALLTLNPQDHAAITGLLSLNRDSDRAHSLSTVKQLIKQRNASASLFFLLGNLHAANGSWPEAQGAYFEAWNRDNSNADYAYNLAVSLDSLNRRNSALTYYKTALTLANKSTARFDRNELQRRIRELRSTRARGRL